MRRSYWKNTAPYDAILEPDANGDFIRLGGSNIYFTEAVIDQN